MDMPARAINRNCLDLMSANWRFAAAIEKLVMRYNLNVIALAIRRHPRSKYCRFKLVFNYEEVAQIPSRILKIDQYEIQKTIPLRYMGLKFGKITSFQLKIGNPWRYMVWPYAPETKTENRRFLVFSTAVDPYGQRTQTKNQFFSVSLFLVGKNFKKRPLSSVFSEVDFPKTKTSDGHSRQRRSIISKNCSVFQLLDNKLFDRLYRKWNSLICFLTLICFDNKVLHSYVAKCKEVSQPERSIPMQMAQNQRQEIRRQRWHFFSSMIGDRHKPIENKSLMSVSCIRQVICPLDTTFPRIFFSSVSAFPPESSLSSRSNCSLIASRSFSSTTGFNTVKFRILP